MSSSSELVICVGGSPQDPVHQPADGDVLEFFTPGRKADQLRSVLRNEGADLGGRQPPGELPPELEWLRPSVIEFCRFLWVRSLDVTDARAAELMSDIEGQFAHRYAIKWRELPGMTPELISRVESKTTRVDGRLELPVVDVEAVVVDKLTRRARRG